MPFAASRANNPTARCTVIYRNCQIRFEPAVNDIFLELSNPLCNQCNRYNNQCPTNRNQIRQNKPNHHDCLSKTHLVCDNSTKDTTTTTTTTTTVFAFFTSQTKLNTFALVCFRFKTGFCKKRIKRCNTTTTHATTRRQSGLFSSYLNCLRNHGHRRISFSGNDL